MTTEILLRYLHFLSIIAIAGSLTAEHVLIRKVVSRKEISRIAIIDGIYGIAAVVLLGAGLTLWLGSYTKPDVYYSQNWIFITKMGLVAAMGILSIYPTIFFLRQRRGDAQELVTVPSAVLMCLRLELLLLVIIPLLAGLMSRGVGLIR